MKKVGSLCSPSSSDMFSKLSQLTQLAQEEQPKRPQGPSMDQVRATLGQKTPDLAEIATQTAQLQADEPKDASQKSIPTTNIPLDSLSGLDPKLMQDLVAKMSKFAKYDTLYPKLHEAYKVEKKKSAFISQFEAVLAKYTPVETIADIEGLDQYLSGNKSQNEMSKKEIQKLQRENKASLDKVKELELKLKEKAEVEWKLREAEVKLRQLAKKQEQDQNDFKKDDAINPELEKKVSQLEMANSEMGTQLENLKQDLAKSTDETKELNDKLSESVEKYEKLQTENDSNVNLAQKYKSKVQELTTQLDTAISKTGKGPRGKKGKSKKPDAIKDTETTAPDDTSTNQSVEFIELQHSLEQSQTQISTLQSQIQSKSEEIENLKDMLKEVGNSLVESEESNKQNKAQQDDIANLKNELEMVRLQNSNSLKDYEKTKNNLNKKLETNVKLVEELESKLNDAILERDQLKSQSSDVSKLQAQLQNKESQLLESSNRIKFLQEEKTKLNDSLIEFKVQSKQLSVKEKSFDEFKNNLTNINNKLKHEITESSIQISKLTLENNQLEKQLDELNDKFLKQKSQSSDNQIDSLKSKLDEINMQNKELQTQKDILQEELTQTRSLLQDRTRECAQLRKILIDNDQNQNDSLNDLKSKFDSLLEEKSQLEDTHLKNIRSKLKELDEYKLRLVDFEESNEKLKLEVKSLNDQLEKVKTTSFSAKATPPISGKQNNDNNNTNNNGSDHSTTSADIIVDQLRQALNETQSKMDELEKLNSKLRKANQESSDKLLWLQKKYKTLSTQYKRRVSEVTAEESRRGSVMSQESGDTNNTSTAEGDEERAVYIKNVLLGFLEHKEQRMMLLPVIKTLLCMTDDDEKKFQSFLN